jgi:hypothetical protein
MQRLLLLIIHITIIANSLQAQKWTDGQAAAAVIGQSNFTSGAINRGNNHPTGNSLAGPQMVIVDSLTGKVFIADYGNNRILRFASIQAATNNVEAEAVLGQATLTGYAAGTSATQLSYPTGLSIDVAGNLWVVDEANSRVLRFPNAASFSSGEAANMVIGQNNFITAGNGTADSSLTNPRSIFIHADTLWLSDAGNNRILRYDNISAKPAFNAKADGVLGQINFTSNDIGTSATTFQTPTQIYVDAAGALWVADQYNGRILRFDNAGQKPFGAAANGVLGQADFTSNDLGTTTKSTFSAAVSGVYGDNSGSIYASDQSNSRVLVFNNAAQKANGDSADYVLGQNDFSNHGSGTTAATLKYPITVFYSGTQLFIADGLNNRILVQNSVPPILLPVKLLSFTGNLQNNNAVLLQWQTADEQSIKEYELQYSTDGADFNNVLTIAAPTGLLTNQYSYLHNDPVTGSNYYRIKTINDDGSADYSNILLININSDAYVSIYPNPATNNIVVTLPDTNLATLRIFNSTGSLVKTVILTANITTIDVHDFQTGTYFITIVENTGRQINSTLIKE